MRKCAPRLSVLVSADFAMSEDTKRILRTSRSSMSTTSVPGWS